MLNPEADLNRKLKAAESKLRRLEGRTATLRLCPYYLLLLALLLTLDLTFHFSPLIRLCCILGMMMLSGGLFIWMLWYGYGRAISQRRVARHLESIEPELGSSLINYLDLQSTAKDPSVAEQTKKFAQHALKSHAATASALPLDTLPHVPQLKVVAKRFGYTCLASLIIIIIAWPIVKAHIPRFLDPYGDHPPYSLTSLSFITPNTETAPIVYGEELRIKVEAKGHRPEQVELLYWPTTRPDEVFHIGMLNRSESEFTQQISEINEPITVMAQTPNGRTRTQQQDIKVYMIPQLESVEIEIIPPSYTQLPTSKRPYQFNEIRALNGSTIRLTATSNRPLKKGSILIQKPLEEKSTQVIEMSPNGLNRVVGEIAVSASEGFKLTITDKDGLQSEASPNGSIYMLNDRKPSISITKPGSSSFLSLDASVDVIIEAHDDYGITELRIHRAVNGIFSAPKTIRFTEQERSLNHTWNLDFRNLGLQPEDIILVYAEVIDNQPEPQISRSDMIRIAAISVEDYNALLRKEADLTRVSKKYEAIREQFEQTLAEQEAIQKELEELMKRFEDAESDTERAVLMEEFAELQARQDAVNDQMDQLAKQLAEAVRDNPLYDVESAFREQFKEEAYKLHTAASTNRAKNHQLKEKMQGADSMSPAEQQATMEEFNAALKAQRELLVDSAQASEAAAETMEDMALFHEMVKNFNRFASLANQQQALAELVAAYDKPGKLSREDQLALRDLALDQKTIADEIQFLTKKFRADAEAGAEDFPKAAASSQEFADAIEAIRAVSLGHKSTQAMIGGEGNNSAALSQAMSEAMNSLIGQCNGGMGQMRNELDKALSASRPGGGSATFQQMLENLQMRYSGSGMGPMTGTGSGTSTGSGYSTQAPDPSSVYGNESLAAEGNQSSQDANQSGAGSGDLSNANNSATLAKPGSLDGLKDEERKTSSSTAESLFIEHDTLIDAYFKKITEAPE